MAGKVKDTLIPFLEHEVVPGSIVTADLANSAVTAAKLASDAVETAKIKDLNVTTGKMAANAVTGPKMAIGAFFAGHFTGRNGAGAITLTGAKVGDKVIICTNLTDEANGATNFESTITVVDQIQQSSASDLSTKKFGVLLLVQS